MTMIRDVLYNTGITATAGVGTNLYLAKIAMDIVAKKAAPDKDGVLVLDEDDEVIRGITVTLDGTGMWPPPAVSVSATPKKEETPAEAMPVEEPKKKSAFAKWWWKVAAVLLGAVVVMLAPPSMTSHFVVLEAST